MAGLDPPYRATNRYMATPFQIMPVTEKSFDAPPQDRLHLHAMHRRAAIAASITRVPRGTTAVVTMISINSTTTGTGTGTTSGAGCGSETE